MSDDAEQFAPVKVPAREIFPPSSISLPARFALSGAAQMPRRPPVPALDDTQGWLDTAAVTDSFLTSFLQNDPCQNRADSETQDLGGVKTYVITPHDLQESDRNYILIDIHGGGLTCGGGEACRLVGVKMATTLGAKAYAIDYRMPPLHPYPAPLDDCVNAYRGILERHDPSQIVIQGSSAGGNLAAAMMLRAHDEGLPMPAGLILRSPELDLTESGDSFQTNGGIDTTLVESLMPANLLYANGHDLSDPYVSPLFGDFTKGFPPTIVTAGTRDVFLSNAARMSTSLRRANIPCELFIYEAQPHGGFFFMAQEDHDADADVRYAAYRLWANAQR